MLPSGTVTFLFTDIEGSTERWDRDAGAMRSALATHDRILDEAITGAGGHLLKGKGDGVIAVFGEAPAGLYAAVDAQRRIESETWPESVAPIRVRMALHTGTAVAEDGDYHAHDVNRAARLESAAHGGQIIVSESTALLVRPALGHGWALVDLGDHHLRGLSQPMRIFQVAVPGLPTEFPPLRVQHASGAALPSFPTPFLGRSEETARIRELVSDVAPGVVTITGPGGVGKTRLAIEAARTLASSLADGAYYIPLDAVGDTDGVVAGAMAALGLGVDAHSSDRSPKDQLLDYLGERAALLVLDNVEQVPDIGSFLTEARSRAPTVAVVATSRRRLGLQAEWVVELSGLSHDAAAAPAVELFGEVARRRDTRFDLDSERATVAEVCRVLDGVPLAIELAASWIPTLTTADVLDELKGGLDVLEATSPDLPARHRSMRAVFDRSWGLLSDSEQESLAKLTVFPGTFDRRAAAAVAGAGVRTLAALVDASMIESSVAGRFRLRRTTREYAAERLADADAVREAHAGHYLEVLASLTPDLGGGEHQIEARDRAIAERLNLELAVEWAVAMADEAVVLRAIDDTEQFYSVTSWHDGRRMFDRLALLAAQRVDPSVQATRRLRTLAGAFAAFTSDVEAAETGIAGVFPEWETVGGEWLGLCHYVRGIVEAERGNLPSAGADLERAYELTPGNNRHRAGVALWLGWALLEQGDVDRALELWRIAEDIYRSRGDTVLLSFALSKLGLAADAMGDHRRAVKYHEDAHDRFAAIGDRAGMAYTLTRLSWSHWLMGEFADAKAAAVEALGIFEDLGHRWGSVATLDRLGFAQLGLGEIEEAAEGFRRGMARATEEGLEALRIYALIGLAWVAEARGELEVAARLAGWLTDHAATLAQYRHFYVEPLVERLRAALGSRYDEVAPADAGRTIDDVIAIAATV